MPVISGNIASTYTSTAYNIPALIKSFSLANKTGGTITVTVGIVYGSTFDILYNNTLAASGSADCGYVYTGREILLPALNRLFIAVSGSCDFYFTILPYK